MFAAIENKVCRLRNVDRLLRLNIFKWNCHGWWASMGAAWLY